MDADTDFDTYPDPLSNTHSHRNQHGHAYTHKHEHPKCDPHQHTYRNVHGYVDIDTVDYPDFKSFAQRHGDKYPYGDAYKHSHGDTHGKPVSYWYGYPIGDFKSYADKYLHGDWHSYAVPNPIANGNVYTSYKSTGNPSAWRRLLLLRDLRCPYPEAPVDTNTNPGARPNLDAKGSKEMNPERIKRLEEILAFCSLNYGHTAEYVRKLYGSLRMAAVLGFKYDTSTDNGMIWIDLRAWATNQYLREMHK